MIGRSEIESKAQEFRVPIANVERDYVFGWLLTGIYLRAGYLHNLLVLKGGNGMRKAYFPYTRFSGGSRLLYSGTRRHRSIYDRAERSVRLYRQSRRR